MGLGMVIMTRSLDGDFDTTVHMRQPFSIYVATQITMRSCEISCKFYSSLVSRLAHCESKFLIDAFASIRANNAAV